MLVMVIFALAVLGLALGSFINALVWRVHEQTKAVKSAQTGSKVDLSIVHGRSVCPHCKHQLAAKDLIPVISWLSLKGKCRYCGRPIPDSPLVELSLPLLLIGSYIWWPYAFSNLQIAAFVLWLVITTGLTALLVYDLKWQLLPDRLMGPLAGLSALFAFCEALAQSNFVSAVVSIALAVLVGGGLFYVLFQVSGGRWIGGGDVKLGALLGLLVGSPGKSLLFIFLAAFLGSLVSLPLLMLGKLKRSSTVPFGPFLIIGGVISVIFGHNVLAWYTHTFLSL